MLLISLTNIIIPLLTRSKFRIKYDLSRNRKSKFIPADFKKIEKRSLKKIYIHEYDIFTHYHTLYIYIYI